MNVNYMYAKFQKMFESRTISREFTLRFFSLCSLGEDNKIDVQVRVVKVRVLITVVSKIMNSSIV